MSRARELPAATWVGVLVLGALILATCASGRGGSELASDEPVRSGAATTTPTTTPAPTTSLPPGGRQPDADDPLRVLFTGDSIGMELAAPAMAAFGGGGAAVTYFVANPSIPRDPTLKGLWEARLDESDPDVIVVLVGIWERMGFGAEQQEGQSITQYRGEVIDPFVDLVTSQGAELIWVSAPVVDEPTAGDQISFLDEAFRSVGETDDRVEYIDAAGLITGPNGEFLDVVTRADGTRERIRRVDGTHLCPGGAVRMAEAVIWSVAHRWNLPVADDWPVGDWRAAVPFEDADVECPAVD